MDFSEVIANQKIELVVAPVKETENEKAAVAVLTDSDIPKGMSLTHRLDKMTTEQARFAVQNGDAWVTYLKANGGEVYQSTGVSETELSDVEKYQCICQVLDRVWLSLTGNMKRRDLDPSSLNDWVDTLQWAIEVTPSGYEGPRGVIEAELDYWCCVIANGKKGRKEYLQKERPQ